MKILFCVAFILLSTSHLSFAQQVSQSDWQQLEYRISSEIQTLRNEMKVLGVKIDEMDKRISNRIDEMDKRITAQFSAQESKISMVQWTLGLLIVVIVAILALPQAVSFTRERRGQEELSELRETVKQLKQQLQKQNENVPSKSDK